MDFYPLDLILAVATASATIFFGFLPTKNISSTFFAQEASKFLLAWALIAFLSPSKISHYPFFFAFLCFASWWNFRRDNALSGKMWLSVASGLGISVGIMFILAVTPRAYPPGLTPLNQTLLLASIYLGGAIIGLAYVCFALIQGTKANSGVTHGIIQRYVGLLFVLTIIRAVVLLSELLMSGAENLDRIDSSTISSGADVRRVYDGGMTYVSTPSHSIEEFLLIPLIILMGLAFAANRAIGFSSRIQPTRYLVAILLLGFLTEILARLLVL
jgi:hypothetical protein